MIKEYQVASGVMAFSTTRKGGVSQGNYGEFNINEFCGDNAEHVAENRKRLATELGFCTESRKEPDYHTPDKFRTSCFYQR